MYVQQDPATKYYGHLLLANIIAKFAIHKRIVLQVQCVCLCVCLSVCITALVKVKCLLLYLLQVFHSLLKAHALEARSIVRQALEILTPVVPIRMEDANVSIQHI